MMPMLCPQCSHSDHRATATNSKLDDQIVRRRVCQSCGHVWFTVEVMVPSYAVGWSAAHLRKPVLRIPLTLDAGHTKMRISHEEVTDQLAPLREANERKSAAADKRYGM
jgi:transcriptional regulator NrdR family protein